MFTLLVGISIQWASAQVTCGATAPELPTEPTIIVGNFGLLGLPPLATTGNLPDIEYAVQLIGTLATDSLGDQIIGFTDNTIDIADLNVQSGDQFRVTPIAYDLGQIQSLIDMLYNGNFIGLPCCTVAGFVVPDVCPTLMQAGISQGSDIQDLSDVATIIAVFNEQPGAMYSVPGFLSQVDGLNEGAGSLPNPCGGTQLPICYAVPSLEQGSQVYEIIITFPIQLTAFTAYAERNYNLLKWTTETEENNAYFSIQRSADGQNFDEIGRVAGSGTTTATMNYEFTDNQPLNPLSYYRLQQVDFDGKSSFSDIISVTRKEVDSFDIISFGPNPNYGEMEVVISDIQSSNVNYFVTNINGNILAQNNLTTIKGLNTFQVNLTDFPAGIYFISIVKEDKSSKHLKFFKK